MTAASTFIKWHGLLVWHLLPPGAVSTSCGLLMGPKAKVDRTTGDKPPGRLCSICWRRRRDGEQLALGLRRSA